METPELEKIAGNAHNSQLIGEFIEWLSGDQNITLMCYVCPCALDETHEVYAPNGMTIEQLLALYYGVDLKKAEKERQGLLDELREQNN